MTYNWFYIFNLAEFEALGLVSKGYYVNLTGIGPTTILVSKGVGYSMLYNDVFLPLSLNDKNPFEFDSHAIYIDPENQVWLGVPE